MRKIKTYFRRGSYGLGKWTGTKYEWEYFKDQEKYNARLKELIKEQAESQTRTLSA